MVQRFNPAPGWPRPPEGWVPPAGWTPDSSWPPAPPGWQFGVTLTPPIASRSRLVERWPLVGTLPSGPLLHARVAGSGARNGKWRMRMQNCGLL